MIFFRYSKEKEWHWCYAGPSVEKISDDHHSNGSLVTSSFSLELRISKSFPKIGKNWKFLHLSDFTREFKLDAYWWRKIESLGILLFVHWSAQLFPPTSQSRGRNWLLGRWAKTLMKAHVKVQGLRIPALPLSKLLTVFFPLFKLFCSFSRTSSVRSKRSGRRSRKSGPSLLALNANTDRFLSFACFYRGRRTNIRVSDGLA